MSILHIFKESLILTIHTCRYQGWIQRGVAHPRWATIETPWKKEERMREKKRKEGIEEEERQIA